MKDFDLSAFLADLRTLCAIDSGHFNAPGTAAVADFFESRYRALGLKTERRYYDNNDFAPDRKSTRLNSSHNRESRMPSSA